MNVLKQKKMYEGQMGQLSQQSFNMESATLVTENLRNTMATVKAMETANKEMKKQYGKIDIDKIEVNIAPLRYGAIPTPYFIIIECPL
jgi:charged multivesicular body protein 5